MKDPETGRVVRTGDQKTVIATFRHDTSRNLDPALHTHSVIANMVRGADGKWRSMANERLYESKMLLGSLYRNEPARGLSRLGYGIEKTHADGRFEIDGVSRNVIEAFSTRRAEIEAAVAERGGGATADDQRLAQRAALMTRAAKRDVDRDALRESWLKQAEGLGFDAPGLAAQSKEAGREAAGEAGRGTAADREAGPASGPAETGAAAREDETRGPAAEVVDWAVAHLSEREAVFARTDLLAAALAFDPGGAEIAAVERELAARQTAGSLHPARLPGAEGLLTTDRAVADEKETIGLMQAGQGRGATPSGDRAIVISTLPIFSERWLYRRIPSFRKAFDRAELRIEVHNGEHDAEREDVDAWIMYSKGQHPGYSVTRLFGEDVFPVCSPQFRETLSAHPGADEVIGQPLLHDMYWDTDWPDWARAVGATAGELAANMRFALYKGVIQAAVDGMGMAVGHGEMVAKELATGKLVPLAHLSVVSEKSYHLVMTASSANDRTLVRLKEWLLQECAGGKPSNG